MDNSRECLEEELQQEELSGKIIITINREVIPCSEEVSNKIQEEDYLIRHLRDKLKVVESSEEEEEQEQE